MDNELFEQLEQKLHSRQNVAATILQAVGIKASNVMAITLLNNPINN